MRRASDRVLCLPLKAWFSLGAAACATGPALLTPIVPSAPGELAKCKVAASMSSPLVTEWPASEKANLEGMLASGAVAVAYSGCNMRVLPQCHLKGGYHWQRTTPSTDVIEINNEDDLYAKLPLGAASLEGELKRSGRLSVYTTVSGRLKLEGVAVAEVPGQGECASATHLVGALSVGAFSLKAGADLSGKTSASVASVGEAGAGTTRSKEFIRAAGDVDSCGQSTTEAPHQNCASPIQVFLWPLPGRAAEEGPPGTVKVDFISADANGRWDVYSNDEVICSTPCSKWVDPARPVLLRARSDAFFFSKPDQVSVPGLAGAGGGPLQLQAHPTATGQRVTGIVFTALGGWATLAGITLTAVGYGREGSGMGTAGLITLGIGAPVTAGGIWLMLDAAARAEIRSLAGAPVVPHKVVWGPGFVAGTF